MLTSTAKNILVPGVLIRLFQPWSHMWPQERPFSRLRQAVTTAKHAMNQVKMLSVLSVINLTSTENTGHIDQYEATKLTATLL
jgi:hypothetical protein